MTEYTVTERQLDQLLGKLSELRTALTERIEDLHGVQGGMQGIHAYTYYRSLLDEAEWTFRDAIRDNKEQAS